MSKLSDLLVRYGVVQEAAVEDPDGYDGWKTADAIVKVEAELGFDAKAVDLYRKIKVQKEALEREVYHLSGAILTVCGTDQARKVFGRAVETRCADIKSMPDLVAGFPDCAACSEQPACSNLSEAAECPKDDGCTCPKVCDCQNPPPSDEEAEDLGVYHTSVYCPVHNDNPDPDPDCPVHGKPVPPEARCQGCGSSRFVSISTCATPGCGVDVCDQCWTKEDGEEYCPKCAAAMVKRRRSLSTLAMRGSDGRELMPMEAETKAVTDEEDARVFESLSKEKPEVHDR